MPSYNTNLLPASTGLNLGSSNQLWNAWLNLLNNSTPVNFAITTNAFTATPALVATAVISVQTMTLIGDVTSSTYSGPVGLLVVQITQDSVGGHAFTWPTTFKQATSIDPTANAVTSQLIYFDGTNGWPLTPGTVYP